MAEQEGENISCDLNASIKQEPVTDSGDFTPQDLTSSSDESLSEEDLRSWHLDYVAKPYSFSLLAYDIKRSMGILAKRSLEELNLEDGSVDLKKCTIDLVTYLDLKNPHYDGQNHIRRQRLIEMAYMTGSNVDHEKLAECIKFVLESEKKGPEEFAKKVLNYYSTAIFKLYLVAPSEELENINKFSFSEKIRGYLHKDREARRMAWN